MQSTLRPLTREDFEPVIEVARRIWRAHYAPLIGAPQVEYMLERRFTVTNLSRYLEAGECWFDVLRCDDVIVGYCSYARAATPDVLKLEQLYLLAEMRGRGWGASMLRHVEQRAATLGCASLTLQVNKRNVGSIAVYRKAGFTVLEEAVFDIGDGYVMDDFVMGKRLSPRNIE